MNKKILAFALIGFGLLFFIPDPLDFVFGIGVILEAVAGVVGLFMLIKK